MIKLEQPNTSKSIKIIDKSVNNGYNNQVNKFQRLYLIWMKLSSF